MRQTQLLPVFISLIKTILNYRSYPSTKLTSTCFRHPLLSSEPPKHVAFSRSSGRSAISFYDDLCTDALLRQQQRCKHRHTLQTHFNLINITDDDCIYICMLTHFYNMKFSDPFDHPIKFTHWQSKPMKTQQKGRFYWEKRGI